jgi:hypothetical protein
LVQLVLEVTLVFKVIQDLPDPKVKPDHVVVLDYVVTLVLAVKLGHKVILVLKV